MYDRKKLEKEWAAKAAEGLVGLKIEAVEYVNWVGRSGVLLKLTGGVEVMASGDDEGNGPGALFTNLVALPCIPVI